MASGENGGTISGGEDTNMVDTGERGRPPGDPPDRSGSWVQKVVGSNAGGMPVPEEVLNDDFVSERLHLEFPNGEDGEPVITIGKEVLDAMNGLWSRCMIVKVLGRSMSIAVLSKRLRDMWKPAGAMYVMDLPRQFFMVRFESEEEYMAALTGGPWRIFGSYLMVQAWSPEFDPLRHDIATTPVWVRLSNLPVNLYHKSILMGIARGLGKPIRVDLTTLNFERARFARVCVEVNLAKPLKGTVVVNGERYYVAYEGLTNICSGCGVYGHLIHMCPRRVIEETMEVSPTNPEGPQRNPVEKTVCDAPADDGFTVVRRSGRKTTAPAKNVTIPANKVAFTAGNSRGDLGRNLKEISAISGQENINLSNRYGSLNVDMISSDLQGVNIVSNANKENSIGTYQAGKGKSGAQEKGLKGGGNMGRANGGRKEGPSEKRPELGKQVSSNGPKGKHQKVLRPMRGLVFGPTREEIELSASGKRLRVEKESWGRPGGRFTSVNGTDMIESEPVQTGIAEMGSLQSVQPEIRLANEGGMIENPTRGNVTEQYMLKKFNTDILAIFETHAAGDRAMRICRGLGFENSCRVDAVGQSGGLWLLWRSEVGDVEIVELDEQFIYAKVKKEGDVFHLITVYAAPSATRRSGLWGKLRTIIQGIDGPMMIGGDFNTIVRLDERMGGNGQLSSDSLEFGDWINEMALIDMGFRGNKFTWRRGRVEQTCVAKRLDRVMCCAQTRLRWQEAVVSHLPFFSSDHAPIYVQLSPEERGNPSRRPFRFEAAWLTHESFKELLAASWKDDLKTPEALKVMRRTLKKWNKDVFGDVQKRKDQLMQEITDVQDLLDQSQTDTLLAKESELLKEFDLVLEQEEILWFQKSREKWIVLGERNTKYFHTSTIIRRRRNRIEALKDDEGRWVVESQELEKLAVDYYQRLYSMVDIDQEVDSLPKEGFTRLTREELQELNKPFSPKEIENSVRSMGKYKAPGPDGFQPVFYQHCWEVVGPSVVRFVLDFFETGALPPETNDALIVLIAKVAKPEKITQFRPISLCNVLFKTITKVMVMRLKRVMSNLIGPAQASFIPGRLSTDNIVIVQEAVHSMRRKKGRKGWMLLKLDLKKAYDRIRWDFLEDTLKAAGLPEVWVHWILQCVCGPSMNVLWNGEKTEAFKPSRGLRQGDPLSPYLFVMCMERLCHQIEFSVAAKEWKPISLSCGGPKLSHICFADDLILFAEASVAQIRIIRRVLERFCIASGQKVSLEKSKIFFSENVHRDLIKLISDESGIQATRELGKYLGMPILQKRINKDTYGEVLEKMSTRLSGWKGRFLSMSGRVTLTKAVLSSIPVHSMSTIMLPASTLKKLDQISRDFIWGSTVEKRKQHLLAWKKVCRPKREGGLGIRSAKNMNKALLAKIGWRLLHETGSLWAKILRAKYKVGDPHDKTWAVVKSNWSSTWRSVTLGIREVIFPGLGWVVGDGNTIHFWTDKWLTATPLLDLALIPVPVEMVDARARSYWSNGRGWDLSRLSVYLPENVRMMLTAVVVDTVTGARDRLSWGENADGKFTVKSAYSRLTREDIPNQNVSALFGRVWRAEIPERVRLFFWLVVHQVVMTNVERNKRHLCDTSICQVCKGGEETILHVLRDCPAMEGIWIRLVPLRRQGQFFSQSLLEWIYGNLGDEKVVEHCPWSTRFAMACWWGWKWRCGNVFGTNGKCRDRVRFVKEISKEVFDSFLLLGGKKKNGGRFMREIAWRKPEEGWVKVNTDGASHGNPGLATAGGVIRDGEGNWCGGFAVKIGICSAPLAELWGVYYGLYLAWERRATRVELEVDSELVVGFLKTGVSDSHPLSFLVRLCYGFISKDWIVRISHVYREANRLADGLANYAFSLPLGFHSFVSMPDCVCSILATDASGATTSRQFSM
ncbi:Ribonuclease H domain [Arabidopsis thaliana x Arabidopsis arenosa]|uniref:Ribonuclease H domain n=1 Tax=Arabidopsis thaliana x Arabidopsis arenosa TaxID=1240361 RepID=A0A8T2B045_9BRAS|nr:Ribonuclease H domain [Arabidopsis thaliana x Arabidopsis arenosa]